MDLNQGSAQLGRRVEARGEAAHERDRAVAFGRRLQQEDVLFDCLADDAQGGIRAASRNRGERLARDGVCERRLVVGELEERWEADGEVLGKKIGVEFLHSGFAARHTSVYFVAVVGNEVAAKCHTV